MKFNIRKAKKIDREHYDSLLDKNRNDRGHKSPDGGTYEDNLSKNRKDKEPDAIYEKTLQKHHSEEKKSAQTIEARLDNKDLISKRDDSLHKTNTLPINELAEEAQRERMKAAGMGNGLDKDHYQNYKKEDLKIRNKNFGRLKEINKYMDALWMASTSKRLTTAEKEEIKKLQEERDKLLES